MLSTIGLIVLVINASEEYKHWGLFIDDSDDPQTEDNFLQIQGPPGRQWYESKKIVFQESPGLCDFVYMCRVNVEYLDEIRNIAEQLPIHNETPNWNSQDYVLYLLGVLEFKGIMAVDNHYLRQKRVLERMQEREDSRRVW